MNIVIAGGGVAGLEALLALRAIAGERVSLTLIAPDPDFSYRPMAVAEPFARGRAHQVALRELTDDAGAELSRPPSSAVDDEAGEVRLDDGGTRGFDALILATGGRAVSGVEGATTWWPGVTPRSTAASCATSTRATRSGSRWSSRPARSGRCPSTSWR